MPENQLLNARRNELIVWASFLFLMLTWGSSFILIKRSLEAFSAAQVASLRLASAMLALIGFAVSHVRQIPRDRLPYVFLSGLFGMFFAAFLFSLAETGLSSSITGVLNALTPCMTFVLGIVLFRQKSNAMQIVGLLLGFVGSATLVLVNAKGEMSVNHYAFYVIAATICYGLNLNIVKRFLPNVKAFHLSTVSVSMVGLLGLAYLLTTNWLDIVQNAPNGKASLLAAVTLGVVGTAAAQVVFNRMLQNSTAVFASSITYFIPIVALIWGVWDGEVLSVWHYAGMVLIMGGILILNRFR